MIVVNLFGGPGIGKSMTAAGLFYFMKRNRIQCELVTEYAKDLTWREQFDLLADHEHVLEVQQERQDTAYGKVLYIITDSPLLLSEIYTREETPDYHEFIGKVRETYNSYNNINILLNRSKPYDPNGRNQTEDEAREIDERIETLLDELGVEYYRCNDDPESLMHLVLSLKFPERGRIE